MRMLVNKIALNGTLLALNILSPLPDPTFQSYPIPTANSQPRDITLGADGNMWFTESELDVSQIGRIDAQGNITEFVVPTRFSQPSDIISGPDGALWFTAPSGFPDFFIGRVTTDGQFTGFAPDCDPNFGCSIVPLGIASGPDGNLWFTENIRNAVAKLTPSGVFSSIPFRPQAPYHRGSRQVRMVHSGLRSSRATRLAASIQQGILRSLLLPLILTESQPVRMEICGLRSPSTIK